MDDKLRIESWVIYRFFLRASLQNVASEMIKLMANEKSRIGVLLSGFFSYCHQVSVYLQKYLANSLEEFAEEMKFVTRYVASCLPTRSLAMSLIESK
jgi:hypothetical protein